MKSNHFRIASFCVAAIILSVILKNQAILLMIAVYALTHGVDIKRPGFFRFLLRENRDEFGGSRMVNISEAWKFAIEKHAKDYWWMQSFRSIMAVGNQKRSNTQRAVVIGLWVPAIVLHELFGISILVYILAIVMFVPAPIALAHHLVQRYQLVKIRNLVYSETGIYYKNLEEVARMIDYYEY